MDYFDGDKILEQIEQDSFQKAVISGKKDKAIYIYFVWGGSVSLDVHFKNILHYTGWPKKICDPNIIFLMEHPIYFDLKILLWIS